MIKLGLEAFGAAGLLTKAMIVGGMLLSLVTVYGVWHHRIYQSGVDDTIAKIARGDAKTIAKASAGRSAFKVCRDAGRQWDQGSNKCL